ncbi:MAG: membrane protein of unknown function [Promethearchaeota archaeon]|nr:MAG: membrane protein of unknown function [Candidatus Lokiarchaeota archaeon]
MLKLYTYKKLRNEWIQEDQVLLLQDVCVILDQKNSILYLWTGPKAKKEKVKNAKDSLDELINKFETENLLVKEIDNNQMPDHINQYLEQLLEPIKTLKKSELYKFSKLITLRIYLILSICIIGLIISFIIALFSSLSWPIQDGNIQVVRASYMTWIGILQFINYAILFFLVPQLIVGIYEKESEARLFSIVGIMISIGMVLYLNQGIFLFLFQNGNNPNIDEIAFIDLFSFILVNLLVIMIIFLLNVYKMFKFFKTYRKFLF